MGFGTFYELPHGQSTPIAYYNFNSASGTQASASLAFDSHGNLWGAANANGSAGYGTLFEISSNTPLSLSGISYLRMDPDHVRIDVYNNNTGTGTPSLQVPLVSLSTINVSYSSPTATLTVDGDGIRPSLKWPKPWPAHRRQIPPRRPHICRQSINHA